jgi:integrase
MLRCASENRHGPGAESPAELRPIRSGRAPESRHDQAARLKPAATTKQRRLNRAPIGASVVALLRTIRLRVPEDCGWVFQGDAQGKPLQDIKRFWEDVREKADLPAVRINDLRHTFASLLVSGGITLPMIGKLLGHTQVQTKQRYAHLLDDPLRAGPEQVGDMLRAKTRLVAGR